MQKRSAHTSQKLPSSIIPVTGAARPSSARALVRAAIDLAAVDYDFAERFAELVAEGRTSTADEERVRTWSRVGTWGAIADIRQRALHASLSEKPWEVLDSCREMLKECDREHRAILEFLERDAPELLGAVPMIPEQGPTPEDAANRAQAMAGVLGALLSKTNEELPVRFVSSSLHNEGLTLRFGDWKKVFRLGDTATASRLKELDSRKPRRGHHTVEATRLEEQEREKARKLTRS